MQRNQYSLNWLNVQLRRSTCPKSESPAKERLQLCQRAKTQTLRDSGSDSTPQLWSLLVIKTADHITMNYLQSADSSTVSHMKPNDQQTYCCIPIHWSERRRCCNRSITGTLGGRFRRRHIWSCCRSLGHGWVGRVVTVIGPVEWLLQLGVNFHRVHHRDSGGVHAWTNCKWQQLFNRLTFHTLK